MFLLDWLFWWAVLFSAYVALLAAADALVTAYRRRQRARRQLRCDLAAIEREVGSSVSRIAAAFVIAQRLIREEAAERGGSR